MSAVARPHVPWFEAAPARVGASVLAAVVACINLLRLHVYSEFIISANRIRDLARGVMTRYKQTNKQTRKYSVTKLDSGVKRNIGVGRLHV